MLDLLNKKYLPDFFNSQFIPNFFVLILGILLTYKKYSPFLIGISIFILYVYSYFIHVLFHNLPEIINMHVNLHHNYEENKNIGKRIFNLLIEIGTNILFFVIFYYLQKLLHINFVPEIIIFYYGFLYTTVHIINYSIFHTANEHVLHHDTTDDNTVKTCNYGPDLMDKIFETNYSNKFENYNHIIPNIMMSFLITYYFYKPTLF